MRPTSARRSALARSCSTKPSKGQRHPALRWCWCVGMRPPARAKAPGADMVPKLLSPRRASLIMVAEGWGTEYYLERRSRAARRHPAFCSLLKDRRRCTLRRSRSPDPVQKNKKKGKEPTNGTRPRAKNKAFLPLALLASPCFFPLLFTPLPLAAAIAGLPKE